MKYHNSIVSIMLWMNLFLTIGPNTPKDGHQASSSVPFPAVGAAEGRGARRTPGGDVHLGRQNPFPFELMHHTPFEIEPKPPAITEGPRKPGGELCTDDVTARPDPRPDRRMQIRWVGPTPIPHRADQA